MKPETVQNLLDRIKEQGVAAYKEAVKDEPERSALNEGFEMGVVWAQDRYAPVLKATVYRSCPECGGSRSVPEAASGELDDAGVLQSPTTGMASCPACKDAPTAIVETALRKKAKGIITDVAASYCRPCAIDEDDMDEAVDAVLSTVLGRPVRYAKEVGRVVQLNGPVVVQADGDPDSAGLLGAGTLIAILEEAGKEGDK